MLSMPTLGTLLLLLPSLPQDPQPQDRKEGKPTDAVAARTLSDKEARTVVAEFKQTTRNKKARLADRVAAVQALGRDSHESLVKPLVRAAQRDASVTVRKTAAQLLGHQPPRKARPALLSLIHKGDPEPEVLAALLTSLSRAGYQPRDWKDLDNLFARDFSPKHTAVQQALLRLVIEVKERQAWRLLLDHIDEPAPANVDDPSNPPAEYWERRWKAWRVWRSDVKEALFAITGQRFSSREEARVWIRENGDKVGLK